MDTQETYPLRACVVIHLDAGVHPATDNPRRVFVLCHPVGKVLAAAATLGELAESLAARAITDSFQRSVALMYMDLEAIVLPKMDTSPSYRKRLLDSAFQAKLPNVRVTF